MTPMLAKSTRSGSHVSLLQHTTDVCDAAEALFGRAEQPTCLGSQWLRFFRLDPSEDFISFAKTLLAACLFHDWGKANQGMQDILLGRGNGQLFRHEHISVLMLGYYGVNSWLKQRKDIDWDIVLAAVGSHHLKFSDANFARVEIDRSTPHLPQDFTACDLTGS